MRTNHKSKPASSSSMLPAFAKGLGPAGVKRFPYINVVTSTVHKKRETLTHDLHNFELVSKIMRTILDQGTVNEIEPMTKGSRKKRVHSHSMSLQSVVRALRQSGKEWRSVSANRVRTVLEDCAQLTPGTIALVAPDPNPQSEGSSDADRSPIVQQTIDACSTVERLHEEAKKAAHVRFLPTLDHVARATLRQLSHSQHSELSTSIIDAMRFWQVSEHNVSEVSELVTRVETLARVANRGRYVTARLFGSRNYGLCSDQSDVDITVSVSPARGSRAQETDASNRNFFRDLASILRRSAGFTRIIDVSHAHVPIIKFVFVTPGKRRLEGDISLNGSKGLAKSRLIATYLGLDPRVRQVLAVVKLWAIRRELTNHNTLNSFGLMMMAITFLISRRVVPPLQMLATAQVTPQAWARLAQIHKSAHKIASLYPAINSASAPTSPEDAAFPLSRPAVRCLQSGADLPEWTVEGTRAYYLNGGELNRWRSPNHDSSATLLFDMFRYYGFDFDPRQHAISARLGSTTIPRASLFHLPPLDSETTIAEPNKWRNKVRLLAIEDPFDLAVNCGRNAPPEWVEGLLWEMRRAAWTLLPSANHQINHAHGSGHSPLDRLLLPPTEAVYCDAAIWASAYHRALQTPLPGSKALAFDPAVDCVPDRTVDLEGLEHSQLIGQSAPHLRAPRPAMQPGHMRQTF
ncbi:hypothetical protein FBU31_001878 [Coemansia sp. 'formosensis']|nr:hypothetical protein FBU31_001878 [Coemansia sp. 'formosensis']